MPPVTASCSSWGFGEQLPRCVLAEGENGEQLGAEAVVATAGGGTAPVLDVLASNDGAGERTLWVCRYVLTTTA